MKFFKKNKFFFWCVICIGFWFYPQYAYSCKGAFTSVYVIEDDSGNRELEDLLLQEPEMEKLTHLTFGYTSSAYWLRLSLSDVECKDVPLYISVSKPTINYVDFYWVRGDSVLKKVNTGVFRSNDNREFPHNKFSFLVSDPQPEDLVFIRLQNEEGSLKARINYFNKAEFLSYIQKGNFFVLFFFGIIIFQLLYAILQSVIYREQLLYWYCGFVFSIIVHQLFNLGYGQLLIPDSLLKYSNNLRIITSPVFMACLAGFAYHLLDVKQLFQKRISAITRYIIVGFLMIALLTFLPLPAYPYRFLILTVYLTLLSVTVVFLLTLAIISAKKGHIPAYYYLIIHIPIGIILIFQLFINYGLIPYKELYSYSYPMIVILEVTFSMVVLTIYLRRLDTVRKKVSPEKCAEVIELPVQEDTRELYSRLKSYFENKQPYLDPNLKISDVAEDLNTTVHELSRAINQCGNVHFFDFVNSYRISYAKKLLRSCEHRKKYTIETTSMQCGFNNRTSFNNAFKRFVKTTPSAFIKKQMDESEL